MIRRPVFFWLGLFVSCLFLLNFQLVLAETTSEKESRLQSQLSQVEREIAAQKSLLQSKQKETASIKRDVDILTYKINTAQLNIKAKQIEIERLGGDIKQKVNTIATLDNKLEKEKRSLSEFLRQTRELDDNTLAEVILSKDTVNNFFVDLERFNFVEESIQDTLGVVRETKTETEGKKVQLEGRRDAELDAKKEIEAEKANIEVLNKEKTVLLNASKAKENSYKAIIAEKEKQRATIRGALFSLRGATNITFGQALEYAQTVSAKVGIRPSFLLAIITQESNLGQNIGTCNRPQDPPSKSYKAVMKPDRDIVPFERITKALGIDPVGQPVSCPYGGGYGGAMGPAQFIPSTWLGMASAVTAVTGNNPPNPWNPLDAFTASGLYLRDLGADGKTYSSERKAALRYYAGGNWNLSKNAFYGDQVMAIAAKYDKQIAILQND
ncbi:MAG TPA: lytic murein transglycosylase [Candidatus Paceibacterota bacterium]|nr:lytic murein transglycosylase [Candidatus Paceibacterota bacterium]